MKKTQGHRIAAVTIVAAVAAACTGGGETEVKPDADKAAYDTAAATLKKPVATISVYRAYLNPPETKDKYIPKRRPHLDKAALAAATETRHAANGARQNLERAGTPVTKDLQAALGAVAAACTEAGDPEAVAKCSGAVNALDEALKKTGAAASAAGATAKIPQIGAEAITDEAKKGIEPFLKAKGPGPAEEAYIAKRGDAAVTAADLITACQGAAAEAADIAQVFEKAEEPIRLIAVTRKMSMDSQCNALNAADTVSKELEGCRKKVKSTECAIVCGKSKNIVGDGVPAAAFLPLEKAYAEICDEKK